MARFAYHQPQCTVTVARQYRNGKINPASPDFPTLSLSYAPRHQEFTELYRPSGLSLTVHPLPVLDKEARLDKALASSYTSFCVYMTLYAGVVELVDTLS